MPDETFDTPEGRIRVPDGVDQYTVSGCLIRPLTERYIGMDCYVSLPESTDKEVVVRLRWTADGFATLADSMPAMRANLIIEQSGPPAAE